MAKYSDSAVVSSNPALKDENILRIGGPAAHDTIKIGVLPFIRKASGGMEFMLMKPQATPGHPGGPPLFQIAKGTRQQEVDGGWRDLKTGDPIVEGQGRYETPLETALREGREEIGLKASNIRHLYDMGDYSIISESRGDPFCLRVFAAEVKNKAYYHRPQSSTHSREWMGREQMGEVRKDHLPVINDILEKIAALPGKAPRQFQR